MRSLFCFLPAFLFVFPLAMIGFPPVLCFIFVIGIFGFGWQVTEPHNNNNKEYFE